MSTRSQLRFVQRIEQTDETDGGADRVAQVYRHSDGYPRSVLRDLVQLKELLDATRTEWGPGYTAATFVFPDKLSTVELYLDGDPERTIDAAQPADLLEPSNMKHLDQPLFVLGRGVENPADGIHGDEEYLYVVGLPTENPFGEPTEWTVKVRGHSAFLRCDSPAGVGIFAFFVTGLTTSLAFVATPVYYDTPGRRIGVFLSDPVTVSPLLPVPWSDILVGIEFAATVIQWVVDSSGDTLAFSVLGVVLLVVTLNLVNLIAWLLRRCTRALLGDSMRVLSRLSESRS